MSFAAEYVGIQMTFTPRRTALSAAKGDSPPTLAFSVMAPKAVTPG